MTQKSEKAQTHKPVRPDIEIHIKSEPRYVALVRQAGETLALSLGMPEQAAAELALAIDEAVANVIRHGYRNQTDQPITIAITPITENGNRGLEIIVEDECPDVDLERIKSRPLEEVRPGGLGVHLIRRIMDVVQYSHRTTCAGVRLRMCKFIDKQSAATAANRSS